MNTKRFLYQALNARLLLVVALSGVLVTGVIAQGRGGGSFGRGGGQNPTVNSRAGSGYGQNNRGSTSPTRTERGTISPGYRMGHSENSGNYQRDTNPGRFGNGSYNRSTVPNGYQRYQNESGRPTERSSVTRTPETTYSRPDSWQNDRNVRNDYSVTSKRQSSDTGYRSDRGATNNRTTTYNSRSDGQSRRTDSRQYGRDSRDGDRGRIIGQFTGTQGRDYRDRTPAFSDGRDRGRNNGWGSTYDHPDFREGHYYYHERPFYDPCLFGFWAFDDDIGFCRSVYFYYGYFPYMDAVRVHIGPYVEVGYYSTPVIFTHDDYYLAARDSNELDYALSDIRKSWTDNRADLIDNHVNDDQSIAVLLDGKYDYSVEARDYVQMTSDAIDQTKTISFTWESVKQRTDGEYTAFGKHVYHDSYDKEQTVYVSYTLRKIGSHYIIVEVGSSKRTLI